MNSLQRASNLDLLRLSFTIDHLSQSPARILAVRERLHVGQQVDYWSQRENRIRHGCIVKFKPDRLPIMAGLAKKGAITNGHCAV